jgi:hypothetical protein
VSSIIPGGSPVMSVGGSGSAYHQELREFVATLRPYAYGEATFRLRALTEIAQKLDTEKLLQLAARLNAAS